MVEIVKMLLPVLLIEFIALMVIIFGVCLYAGLYSLIFALVFYLADTLLGTSLFAWNYILFGGIIAGITQILLTDIRFRWRG